jgi:hypothetical protein
MKFEETAMKSETESRTESRVGVHAATSDHVGRKSITRKRQHSLEREREKEGGGLRSEQLHTCTGRMRAGGGGTCGGRQFDMVSGAGNTCYGMHLGLGSVRSGKHWNSLRTRRTRSRARAEYCVSFDVGVRNTAQYGAVDQYATKSPLNEREQRQAGEIRLDESRAAVSLGHGAARDRNFGSIGSGLATDSEQGGA